MIYQYSGLWHRVISVSAFSGVLDNGVSASDSVRAHLGLLLRQVNSTLASVALRQTWGLSGSWEELGAGAGLWAVVAGCGHGVSA